MKYGYLLGIAEPLPVLLRTPLMVTGTTGVVMAGCVPWPVVARLARSAARALRSGS